MRHPIALAVGTCALLLGVAAQADVIYQEAFSTDTADATNHAFPYNGWYAHGSYGTSNGVALLTTGTEAAGNNYDAASPAGSNQGGAGTTAGPNAGRVFATVSVGGIDILWTDEFSFDPSSYQTVTFAWDHRNSQTTTAPENLAVRIGSQWYTSNITHVGTSTSVWMNTTEDLSSANWHLLSFIPGTNLGVPDATLQSLPAGTINAFGLIYRGGGTTYRLDNFTISASVPEPSLLSLIGIPSLLALRRRTR